MTHDEDWLATRELMKRSWPTIGPWFNRNAFAMAALKRTTEALEASHEQGDVELWRASWARFSRLVAESVFLSGAGERG